MEEKLKGLFLFDSLDDETIKKIASFSCEVHCPKNDVLFYEGDEPKYLYALTKGIIKLYKVTSSDKEIILKYFHKNELIAEVANFEEMKYPATAQAFSDISVLKIDFEKLKEILIENTQLSYKMMTSLIKKIKNLENLVSMHIVLDSKERVAKYIYDNTNDFFSTKNIIIAEILNISPETLSRILRTFKDDGIIDIKNKTVNKEALESFFM